MVEVMVKVRQPKAAERVVVGLEEKEVGRAAAAGAAARA